MLPEIAEKFGLNKGEGHFFDWYLENAFAKARFAAKQEESWLEKWSEICAFADRYGAAEAVNRFIAVKRPVAFLAPEQVKIELYRSFAGKIPIIYVKNTKDFEALITNVVYKGIEPDNLDQTGASFVFGKTTRFLVLSAKPYSNIPAAEMGLTEKEWREKSVLLRREHECTHYYTKQVFGISRNHLHDELLADFFGLYEAFGEYRAEFFLRFMGLLGDSGGRLRFYTAGMPEKIYRAVCEVARRAAAYLEQYARSEEFQSMTKKQCIKKLCLTDLETMCKKAPAACVREIQRAAYMDYIVLFEGSRTAYMDYNVKNALASGGAVYIEYEKEGLGQEEKKQPAGLLCLCREKELYRISYAFTAEEKRRSGVFTRLLQYVLDTAPGLIEIRLSEQAGYYSWIKPVLSAKGFWLHSACIVYSCSTEDYSYWEAYMQEKGERLCEALLKQGYGCISFEEAPEALLKEIYDAEESDFGNSLSARVFFDQEERCMDKSMSYAVTLDGHLAAYTLVSCPDAHSAVFEQISASGKTRGSGAVFLAFAKSMERIGQPGIKRVSYAMYEQNNHANAFRRKIPQQLMSSEKRSENYHYRKDGGNGKTGRDNL